MDNSPTIRFVTDLAKTVFHYWQSVARKYAFGNLDNQPWSNFIFQ